MLWEKGLRSKNTVGKTGEERRSNFTSFGDKVIVKLIERERKELKGAAERES